MATLQRFVVNVGGKTRREKLEGRWHTVAPVAMLQKGVIPGSKGPIFYDDPDMESSVPAWNHKPIVVYHPKDDAGKPLSGCDPAVLNTRKIGVILNTAYGDKLTTEGWFDEERTRAVDRRIAAALNKGEPIECSTGLFVDIEEGAGEYEGEKYDGTARNYRPDHLAVLPDKLGALPVSRGGGVNYVANEAEQPESARESLRNTFAVIAKGQRIAASVDNELSFTQRTLQITDLLREKYGKPGQYWPGCVLDVYDNRVVFSDGEDYTSLKMLKYEVGQDDVVTLAGEAEPVERVVEYRAASGASYVGNAAGELVTQEEKPMAFDKKAHVAALAAAGVAKEDVLNTFSDEQLQALAVPKAPEPKPVENEKKVVKEKPEEKKPMTITDFLENACPEAKAEVQSWREAAKVVNDLQTKERTRLVKDIVANEANKFKEDYLKDADKCPLDTLRGIHALAAKSRKDDDGVLNESGPRYDFGAGIDDDPVENEATEVAPLEY